MHRPNQYQTQFRKNRVVRLLKIDRPSGRLVGIGIDLLSLERARELLKVHGRSFFDRILSCHEQKRGMSPTALLLAKYFTAKEAFFKASGLSWTDMHGFSGMWIDKIQDKRFTMKCQDSSLLGTGIFFKQGKILGAKVKSWKN